MNNDSLVQMLSDEELDNVSGGARTVYMSNPFINDRGQSVVSIVTVSGDKTYDPVTGAIGGGLNGAVSRKFMEADRAKGYTDRASGRGDMVFYVDLAQPLL